MKTLNYIKLFAASLAQGVVLSITSRNGHLEQVSIPRVSAARVR